MKHATRLKEHKAAKGNCNIQASLVAPHCVDTGHNFDLAETRILTHTNSWTARLIKQVWLMNINKCIELPQACSVLRAKIGWRSIMNAGEEFSRINAIKLLNYCEDGLKCKTVCST